MEPDKPKELRDRVRDWLGTPVPEPEAGLIIADWFGNQPAPKYLAYGHVVQIVGEMMGMVAQTAEGLESIMEKDRNRYSEELLSAVHADRSEHFSDINEGIINYRVFFALQETLETLAGQERVPFSEMEAHREILGYAVTAFERGQDAVRQEGEVIAAMQSGGQGERIDGDNAALENAALATVMREHMKPGIVAIQAQARGRGVNE
jgi:hypothetical protein